MLDTIDEVKLFPTSFSSNRGLVNVFSGQKATPQQMHDLLNFRQIGIEHLQQYIKFHILKHPSSNVPTRKHRLLTMAVHKYESKKRFCQRERELKQVTKCLRQRLAWCNRTGQTYDPSVEQYSAFPCAICDENGAPRKSSKAIWTDKMEKRYSNQTCQINRQCMPVVHFLPTEWVPEVVIMDAMFLIQCNPLRQTMTLKDYAKLILNRFAMQHYQAGVHEVHMLFDAQRYICFLMLLANNTLTLKCMSKIEETVLVKVLTITYNLNLVPRFQKLGEHVLNVENAKEV